MAVHRRANERERAAEWPGHNKQEKHRPDKVLESVERGEQEEAAKDPELAHAYIAENMMGFSVETSLGGLSPVAFISCRRSATPAAKTAMKA